MIRMKTSIIAAALISSALSALGCDNSIVKEEQWSIFLNESIGVGNVAEWSSNGEQILITHENCGITILNKYGQVEKSNPGSVETTCNSGVAYLPDGSLIQAVNSVENANKTSYIQRLNQTDLSQIWNASIVGNTEGTPKVGSYIYLVHNNRKDVPVPEAHFSLISYKGVHLYSEKKENITFSPVSVQVNPPRGPYSAGNNNKNDLVAWGKLYSPSDGFEPGNANYYFQLPKTFDGNFTGSILTDLIRSGGVSGFTRSAPELTYLHTNIYYSLEFYKIRGWTSESSDNLHNWGKSPNVVINPPKAETGNTLPPPNSPTVSSDGKMLFVAGSENNPGVHAYINSTEWKSFWNRDATYVTSKMKLASDDNLLFYMESSINDATSKIIGARTANGDVCFEHNIEDTSFAEFSVFNDSYIVYGTKKGHVTTIKMKNIEGDIIASSAPSSSSSPTASPSTSPSASPSTSPSTSPSASTSTSPSASPLSRPSASSCPSRGPSGSTLLHLCFLILVIIVAN
jgi:hypothetical protein